MPRSLIFPVCLFVAALLCAVPGRAGQPDAQREALAAQVRAILEEHPEIVLDVLRRHSVQVYDIATDGGSTKRKHVWMAQIQKALQNPLKPELGGPRPVLGPGKAPVTIFEYTDFSCEACARNAGVLLQLMEAHPGKVRVFLKHYPSDEFSRQAALYFEAIARQDPAKAWGFQEVVFQRQELLRKKGLAGLQELVDGLGLDKAALARDLADPALAKRIDADQAEAQKFNLTSTPSYVINGVPLVGGAPLEAFENILELLDKAQAAPAR